MKLSTLSLSLLLLGGCAAAQSRLATPVTVLPKADGSAPGELIFPNNTPSTDCIAANYATCKPLIISNDLIDGTNLGGSLRVTGLGTMTDPAFAFTTTGTLIANFTNTGVGSWRMSGVTFSGHNSAGTGQMVITSSTGAIGTSGGITFYENANLGGDAVGIQAPSGAVTSSYTINPPGSPPSANQAWAYNGSNYVWTSVLTNPMTTTGDIIYSSSGSTPARLAAAASTRFLMANGASTAPSYEFADCAAGNVYNCVTTGTSQTITGAKLFSTAGNTTINNLVIPDVTSPVSGAGWVLTAFDGTTSAIRILGDDGADRFGVYRLVTSSTAEVGYVRGDWVPYSDSGYSLGGGPAGFNWLNLRLTGSAIIDGATALSATISVRKGDDSGACNIVVNGGFVMSTTC